MGLFFLFFSLTWSAVCEVDKGTEIYPSVRQLGRLEISSMSINT